MSFEFAQQAKKAIQNLDIKFSTFEELERKNTGYRTYGAPNVMSVVALLALLENEYGYKDVFTTLSVFAALKELEVETASCVISNKAYIVFTFCIETQLDAEKLGPYIGLEPRLEEKPKKTKRSK